MQSISTQVSGKLSAIAVYLQASLTKVLPVIKTKKTFLYCV
jgi:hypothetical protein